MMKCDKIIEKVNILLWKRINFCTDKKKKKKVKDWLKGIKDIISTLHKTKQKFCSFFLGRGDMATEENSKITQKWSIPFLQ